MMQYRDLREFIGAVEKMGELSVVKGVDWDVELREIRDVLVHPLDTPMVVFGEIKDYPPGFRWQSILPGATND